MTQHQESKSLEINFLVSISIISMLQRVTRGECKCEGSLWQQLIIQRASETPSSAARVETPLALYAIDLTDLFILLF
jgi:hypothetical protein